MSGSPLRGHRLEKLSLTLERFAPAVPQRKEGAMVAGGALGHGAAQEVQCCQEAQLINEELVINQPPSTAAR